MFLLPVHSVEEFAPGIFEIALVRRGYRFAPGECAVLFALDGQSRPYSIASGPDEDVLRFLVRRMDRGVVSQWLATRRGGDEVRISVPFGEFRPRASGLGGAPAVWIATGVGIAPFRSCLRARERAGRVGEQRPLCLYGVRHLRDAVDLDLLRRRTELHLAVSGERAAGCRHGRVTDLLDGLAISAATEFYLCGLDAMVNDVAAWLRRRDVDGSRVHVEVFFGGA